MVSFNAVCLRKDQTGKTFLDLELSILKQSHRLVLKFSIPSNENSVISLNTVTTDDLEYLHEYLNTATGD
jgi:hypothetical protein